MRTLVLLDVDGTVLPARRTWTTRKLRGLQKYDLAIPPFARTTVRARPYVLEALTSWHAHGVEIMWLTSWGWKARYLAQALGLPDFRIFYEPSPEDIFLQGYLQRPWKRFAVMDAAEDQWQAPVRILWIDDSPETGLTKDLEKHVEALHPNVGEVKLIRPDAERGLTLKDLRRVASLLGLDDPQKPNAEMH
jgi:hypothetical protein